MPPARFRPTNYIAVQRRGGPDCDFARALSGHFVLDAAAATAAHGDLPLLAVGLIVSIPIIMADAAVIMALLESPAPFRMDRCGVSRFDCRWGNRHRSYCVALPGRRPWRRRDASSRLGGERVRSSACHCRRRSLAAGAPYKPACAFAAPKMTRW